MSSLKSWTGGAVVLLALAGGLRAEVTVSQSNDPRGAVRSDFVSLLVHERTGLDAVSASRMAAIAVAPRGVVAPKSGEAEDDAEVLPSRLTADWLDTQPVPKGDEQFRCLASAVYHEARGESISGQQAVAEVILNRVDDGAFPTTVCGVVNQRAGDSCQFSFVCDGRPDRVGNNEAYRRAAKIAKAMMDGMPRSLTDGATFFHARYVKPGWSKRFVHTTQIGAHLFYRKPVRTAAN